MVERSGQSSDLDPYQGEEDKGLGGGRGGFIVADEAAVAHEPAEGTLDDPAASQDGEAAGLVGAFDDRDGELGPEATDPGGENQPEKQAGARSRVDRRSPLSNRAASAGLAIRLFEEFGLPTAGPTATENPLLVSEIKLPLFIKNILHEPNRPCQCNRHG